MPHQVDATAATTFERIIAMSYRRICLLLAAFLSLLPTSAPAQFLQEGSRIMADDLGLPAGNRRSAEPDEVRIYVQGTRTFVRALTSDYTLNANEEARFHNGVDIQSRRTPTSNPEPLPFRAGVYGEVIEARPGAIAVRLANGNVMEYYHCSRADVKVKDKVEPGTVLGMTGSVGTKRIHLHVQARDVDGRLVNPDMIFPGGQTRSAFRSEKQLTNLRTLRPVIDNGIVRVAQSQQRWRARADYQAWSGRVDLGGTPSAANVGEYAARRAQEDKAIPRNLSRGQRLQQHLQMNWPIWGGASRKQHTLTPPRNKKLVPIGSGSGITIGNTPRSTLKVDRAEFQHDQTGLWVAVWIDGRGEPIYYGPLSATELWAAYQFIRPDEDLQQLGAGTNDVGLVSMMETDFADTASWTFAIHPAIANTILARDAMRLDMVFVLNDPHLPNLPRGWKTYQWFDAPAVISAEGQRLVVEPANGPRTTVMRIQAWNKDGPFGGDNAEAVARLYQDFDALEQIDRFARIVAVLSWLETEEHFPDLAEEVRPERIHVPNRWYLGQIMANTADSVRGWKKKNDNRIIHKVRLESGRTYVIDLESNHFDSVLRLENASGQQLAFDDDSGGFPNARIIFRALENGIYRLVVGSFKKDEDGAYCLRIRPETGDAGSAKIYTVGAGLSFEGSLAAADARDVVRQKSVCKVYLVRMAAGRTYTIDLTSKEFDAYLRLEDAGHKQLADDDDSGGFPNARLVFRPTIDGVYRVVATAYDARLGRFQLRIREQ
jgi:murein DD-endopeptidase MepM/ murein hydrolase activator NlpD